MPDYHCWPIWDDLDVGNVDPETLPITVELRQRLVRWARDYDATLNSSDPRNSGFASEAAEAAFEAEGRSLTAALQAELGEAVTVQYWRDLGER